MDENITRAAKMIAESPVVVALTGSGISTESGIPDFRSPGGLWTRWDPMVYATYEGFIKDPGKFWSMAAELHPLLENARPNPAHLSLVELEKLGRCEAVMTQNIDDLHTKAGSSVVLELHGTYRSSTCLNCGQSHSYDDIREMAYKGEIPKCKSCGGVVKPDVVLFGEPLNAGVLQRSIELSSNCDLMLVIGCGLEVFPAASLPGYARRNRAKLIFVNLAATAYDEMADLVLSGKAGEIMPEVVEAYREVSG